jgi:muramoyltetrapeptide carboxypeptidase
MIRPPSLNQGDTIGIVAPAGWLSKSEIMPAVEIFRSWGLQVVVGENLFKRYNSFAGTDDQRIADFQKMLDDKTIRAIVCARGGYGSIRIIEHLKFDKFLNHPKWIIGYSDITVLHAYMHQHLGIESIHGVMPHIRRGSKPDLISFGTMRSALFGETCTYTLLPNRLNRQGEASGTLAGGNLSVLFSLSGTYFEPDTKNKILFIEDVGEYLYHIDRMMMNLKIRKRLADLKGLIVGSMNDMKVSPSGFSKPADKIIRDAIAGYNYPVIFGFPAGHGPANLSLILGREVKLNVNQDACKLSF